jgi:hypothetical protein
MAVPTDTQDSNHPLSSPLPSLNPELNNLYLSLNDDMRTLFIKVFRFLWGVVNRKRSAPIVSFWCVDLLRLRAGLTSSELSAITYIYLLSHKGAKYIHSDFIYNGVILADLTPDSKISLLNVIKHKGYITRSTRDPGQPYNHRAQHNRQPVYIKLTSKAVNLIDKFERDLFNFTMNTSLDELTGNKKAR